MSRLLTCGFETGDVNEAGTSTVGANTTHTVVGTAPTPRLGSYCFKITCTATTFSISNKQFLLSALKTETWVRFAVYLHPAAGMTGEWIFASMQDSAGTAQNCLGYDLTGNVIRLRSGGTTGGTLLGSSATALPVDSWHLIEWRTQITSTTVGVSQVYLDGNQVINFSGDNTQTSNANVQSLLLGANNTLSNGTGGFLAYDDIAINDVAGTINNARPGDGRVLMLVPSGAGSQTQLTRGGTDTGANWSQVSEVPPSLSQYVSGSVIGNRDLYALQDLSVSVTGINVVEAIALAQNSDATGGSIAPTLKSGATTNEATAVGLTTTAAYVRGRWETDPNTGAAWTGAAINALEAGATVR